MGLSRKGKKKDYFAFMKVTAFLNVLNTWWDFCRVYDVRKGLLNERQFCAFFLFLFSKKHNKGKEKEYVHASN